MGKKILATGNGKCNFSNRQMSIEQYYGSDLRIPAKILEDFTPEDAVRFFERAGMLSREKNGYLYPYSEQASTVLDIFRILLKKKQIRTVTDSLVSGIRQKNGRLTVLSKTENGTAKESYDRVIVVQAGKRGRCLSALLTVPDIALPVVKIRLQHIFSAVGILTEKLPFLSGKNLLAAYALVCQFFQYPGLQSRFLLTAVIFFKNKTSVVCVTEQSSPALSDTNCLYIIKLQ